MMDLQNQYRELLERYLETLDEKNLYFAQQFSRKFIEQEIAPEDVVSLHKDAVIQIFPELRKEVATTHDFLIEMMIHYGLALREHQSLIKKREELHMEMEVAANVQEKLMNATRPNIYGLDIGYVSEAAKKMSGDYIYYAQHGTSKLSVAVADIIGKGIPAALCMSMIKFGMDSIDENESVPSEVLKIINRIVEKSVDNSMFISMYYGMYNAENQHFTYASAGHEPALLYRAQTKQFESLDAKGLLLGVKKEVEYEERDVQLYPGDFVAIMTDGVTEIRTEEGFLNSSIIEQLLREVSNQSAQNMADHLFKELSQIQNFRLHDDFTVAIMKKE